MTQVLIATGHNVTPTVPFVIAPQTPGMIPTRRTYPLSGGIIDEGPYVPFTFPLFINETQYRAVLTQAGLLTATSALVSLYIQDENYDWVYRNGTAIKWELGTDGARSGYFLQDFVMRAIDLRVQA